jgi:hypothetical protein
VALSSCRMYSRASRAALYPDDHSGNRRRLHCNLSQSRRRVVQGKRICQLHLRWGWRNNPLFVWSHRGT